MSALHISIHEMSSHRKKRRQHGTLLATCSQVDLPPFEVNGPRDAQLCAAAASIPTAAAVSSCERDGTVQTDQSSRLQQAHVRSRVAPPKVVRDGSSMAVP